MDEEGRGRTLERRRFLERAFSSVAASALSSTTGAAGFVGLVEQTLAAEGPSTSVPFLDEGAFPLETTVGEGLGRRRLLDLATVGPTTLVTPSDRFFVRSAAPKGLPSAASWRVRVHGLVHAPSEIDLAALLRDARPCGTHLVECAGNSRAAHFGLMSVARWSGVPLPAVLERARFRTGATQVLISGFDGQVGSDVRSESGASWIFPREALAQAFLATQMNGAPLALDHGHPLRLIVPGWYGCADVKWVNEIAALDADAPATGQMREYAGRTLQPAGPRDRELMERGARPEGPVLARDFEPAVIDAAAAAVRVDAIGPGDGPRVYRIAGLSWGGRSPRALHIRFRPADPFRPVETVAEGEAWSLWSHTYRPDAAGRFRVELAIPGQRTRRLDQGYYAREFTTP